KVIRTGAIMLSRKLPRLLVMVSAAVIALRVCAFASEEDGPRGKAKVAVQAAVVAQTAEPSFTRKEDVIYGRKYGTALTMDIFTPKKEINGAAIVFVVSGGFFSSHEAIGPGLARPFLNRGYTVFAVVHGSQPR